MSRKKTLEEFIMESMVVHNGKYDYSKILELNGIKDKVPIVCKIHGEFWQTPSKHLRGQGCPECAKLKRAESLTCSTDEFIRKSRIVHGDKYTYYKTNYIRSSKEVIITCPIHGDFRQRPDKHLIGHGCPKCAGNERITKEDFVERSRKIHGDKYDYTKSVCNGTHNPTIITCPIHGDFKQTPNDHMQGKGCLLCGNISKNKKLKLSDEVVKQRIIDGCDNKYLIPQDFKYVNKWTKVKIVCPKHGEWYAYPLFLWNGVGCPKCSRQMSMGENEIYEFICGLIGKDEVISRDRSVLDGHKELDIYIPKFKLAIEYNGLRWHSEEFNKDKNYHLGKLEECNRKGIRLIQIFEDEWIEKKDILLNKIKHILGFNDGEKIYARNCDIKEIEKHIAKDFLNKNHIQGSVGSTVFLGGYHKGKLIGVMGFVEDSKDKWSLTRFSTDNGKRCIGLGSKMFKKFVDRYRPKYVKSFADRRWTISKDDNLYTQLGFKLSYVLPPDYRYVNGLKREHKFAYRKQKLHRKYGVPLSMTEHEMAISLGFFRIYDCGLFRYEWANDGLN